LHHVIGKISIIGQLPSLEEGKTPSISPE